MGEENKENNKREGRGIMVYRNGRVFEGSWLNDMREGKGCERYENGSSYDGDFHRGKPHGKGIYRWLSKVRTRVRLVFRSRTKGSGTRV